jgi:hypothetical protein
MTLTTKIYCSRQYIPKIHTKKKKKKKRPYYCLQPVIEMRLENLNGDRTHQNKLPTFLFTNFSKTQIYI